MNMSEKEVSRISNPGRDLFSVRKKPFPVVSICVSIFDFQVTAIKTPLLMLSW